MPMPTWARKLWDDVRPNLIWAIIVASSGAMAAAFAFAQNWLDQPVTNTTLFVVFFASCFVLIVAKSSFEKTRITASDGKAKLLMNILLIYLPIIFGAALMIWAYVVGKKVLQMSDDVQILQKRMVRYVLPRSLSQQQKTTIAEYLSKFEPQPVVMKVVPRNEEASSFRADLQQALEKGGWPVASILYDDNVPEGLQIGVVEPMQEPGQQDPFDRLKPKKRPADMLQEAFTHAGVVLNGTSGGSSRDIKTVTITISIGNRRRDKWSVPPNTFPRMPKAELPDDPDSN